MGPGLARGFESPSEIEPKGLLIPALFPPGPFRFGSSAGIGGLSEALDGEVVLGSVLVSVLISTFVLTDGVVSMGGIGVLLDTGADLGWDGFRSAFGGAKRASFDGGALRMTIFEFFCLGLRAPDVGGETFDVEVTGDMVVVN